MREPNAELSPSLGPNLGHLPGAWLLRLPLAMSVFGLRQMASVFGASSGPDLHLSNLGWRNLDPLAAFLGSLGDAAAAAEATLPPASTAARELRNKLSAFTGFRYATQVVGGGPSADPRESFRQASLLPAPARLWALEGIGYTTARRDEGLVSGEEAVLPVLTGRGLAFAEAFAEALLAPLDAGDGALSKRLSRFLRDVSEGAPEGCWQASYENLGLILRLTRPRLLSQVHEALAPRSDLQSLLWHGAGRGLYFAPSELASLPGRPWRALHRARQAPSLNARHNALAGLAWAVTLVNLHSPSLVALRLSEDSHREDHEDNAIAHGVAGATTAWLLGTEDPEPVEELRRQGPSAIAAGCQDALEKHWPQLRGGAPFGALFCIPTGDPR